MLKNCPVEIFQDEKEFNLALKAFKKLNPKNVVEIGSLFGGTLWFWLQSMKNGGKLSVVDMLVSSADGRYTTQKVCHNYLWPLWAKNQGVSFNLVETSSTSQSTIKNVSDFMSDGIDFLFIDGDHSYETVKKDFYNYLEFMNPGGIVAFHDIDISEGSVWYGVKPFWKELKEQYKTDEVITQPGWWGVGVVYL